MKEFKFFQDDKLENKLKEPLLRWIYEFCETFNTYLNSCEEYYLNEHPDIDPTSSHITFPVQPINLSVDLYEGRLWCNNERYYNEEECRAYYTFFYDINHSNVRYQIEVNDVDGVFTIHEIIYI